MGLLNANYDEKKNVTKIQFKFIDEENANTYKVIIGQK